MTTGRGWYEKRFHFVYHGTAANAAQNSKLGDRIFTEKRYCMSKGQCSSVNALSKNVGWSKNVLDRWSDWSDCTRECGGGKQVKVLSCSNAETNRACRGREGYMTVVEQACNTHPCPNEWTCWSAWSECDSTGNKYRRRRCENRQSNKLANNLYSCGQENYQERKCESLITGIVCVKFYQEFL